MSFDPVATMRSAGIAVDQLSDAQRGVLTQLSPTETETLIAVQRRVDAAGVADVEGHILAGIGIF
jgi:hypothetical protein